MSVALGARSIVGLTSRSFAFWYISCDLHGSKGRGLILSEEKKEVVCTPPSKAISEVKKSRTPPIVL